MAPALARRCALPLSSAFFERRSGFPERRYRRGTAGALPGHFRPGSAPEDSVRRARRAAPRAAPAGPTGHPLNSAQNAAEPGGHGGGGGAAGIIGAAAQRLADGGGGDAVEPPRPDARARQHDWLRRQEEGAWAIANLSASEAHALAS